MQNVCIVVFRFGSMGTFGTFISEIEQTRNLVKKRSNRIEWTKRQKLRKGCRVRRRDVPYTSVRDCRFAVTVYMYFIFRLYREFREKRSNGVNKSAG